VARAQQRLAIAVAKLQTRSANVADSLRAVVQLGEARLNLASRRLRSPGLKHRSPGASGSTDGLRGR
jgi:hypothetical protein